MQFDGYENRKTVIREFIRGAGENDHEMIVSSDV